MPQKQKLERLDKVIAAQTKLSRRDVQRLVGRGQISVNGAPVKKADLKIDPDTDVVMVSGKTLALKRHVYIMLNKPRGVVCATSDAALPTVLDLVPDSLMRRGLFPAGRLDKDTEGLLLLTDDGPLGHDLLSPRKHVDKVYYARVDGQIDKEDVQVLAQGMTLGDGLVCLPAGLEPLGDGSECLVTLREGKYHQVKRMLAARGKPVLYLKRLSMGPLKLDEKLEKGQWRFLTEREVQGLKAARG